MGALISVLSNKDTSAKVELQALPMSAKKSVEMVKIGGILNAMMANKPMEMAAALIAKLKLDSYVIEVCRLMETLELLKMGAGAYVAMAEE